MQPMLQALLKDLSKVEVHRESREMAAYEMVIAKSGLKISLSDPEHSIPMPPKYEGSMLRAPGTMSEIADKITPPTGRPALDKTGLQGRYTFMLIYSHLSAGAPDPSSAPDFFTAVQKQIGLTLEAKKDPIDTLIVDHAERVPTRRRIRQAHVLAQMMEVNSGACGVDHSLLSPFPFSAWVNSTKHSWVIFGKRRRP